MTFVYLASFAVDFGDSNLRWNDLFTYALRWNDLSTYALRWNDLFTYALREISVDMLR